MMEEDKLLRFHERLKDFVSKYLNLFLNIVGILALLILLGFGYSYYSKKKEEKAFAEFFSLLTQGQTEATLLSFAEKNSNTEAGRFALIYLWDSALNRGDASLTLKLAEKLEKSLSFQGKVFVKYAKAKAFEEKGDLDAALKIYESISKEAGPLKELLYLDLIRLKEAKKDKKSAANLAQEFLKNYENSTLAGYVTVKLKELSGS
jgi:lipopolysaccharide biosynthesis regulator YciM